MKKLVHYFSTQKERLFILDAIGAIVSTLMLGIVLPYFHEAIGLAVPVLRLLGLIALGFLILSTNSYFIQPKKVNGRLKLVSVANFCYCILTIVLIVGSSEAMQSLGYIYFVVEILIILFLVFLQRKVSNL